MGTGKPKRNVPNVLVSAKKENVILNGPFFYGTLINGFELNKVAKLKSKDYEEKSIHPNSRTEFEAQSWYVEKNLIGDKLGIRRDKPSSQLLEDEVWMMFKNMGFLEMNKGQDFKISAGPKRKQIDIFAKDEHNIFIIFCTQQDIESSSEKVIQNLNEIISLRKYIRNSIRRYYGGNFRISFLLVTRRIVWKDHEKEFAKKEGILFWTDKELESYQNLIDQLGSATKYQLYSILFYGKRADEVGRISVPSMYGGRGNKYYSFLIHPEDLFKIAYVHRREKANPEDVQKSYQRMVNKERLEKIGSFIDKGNSFPNSIIISFNKDQRPKFEKGKYEKDANDITYGVLKFPPYYGSAWIIDGQHRLYGYTKSKNGNEKTHTIPVIAFESLAVKNQANLFIDINQEQKPVNKNLLWDLYPDIYEGSTDEHQQKLRCISLIAKKLNQDKDSLFYDKVQIPSLIKKSEDDRPLTLTNLCAAIKENLLIERDGGLLFKENYEDSIKMSANVIKAYFRLIHSYLKDDWERGREGLMQSNVGVRISFIVFRQLLREFYRRGKSGIYKKGDLSDFIEESKQILSPLLFKLKNLESHKIDEIRKGSTKGLVMRNTQMLLWDLKEDTGFGLELWNSNTAWNPGMPKIKDSNIIELIDDTEIKLRETIVKVLKKQYGNEWFDKGLNDTIRGGITRSIEQDISRFPWKKRSVESMSNEERLKFSVTSSLKEIIIEKKNWDLFKDIFSRYKECVSVQLGFFENFRNKYKHPERSLKLDDVEKGLGFFGMGWVRKCLGLDPNKVN